VHFVAVAAEDVPAGFVNPDAKLPAGVRKFGANTGDLEALAGKRSHGGIARKGSFGYPCGSHGCTCNTAA